MSRLTVSQLGWAGKYMGLEEILVHVAEFAIEDLIKLAGSVADLVKAKTEQEAMQDGAATVDAVADAAEKLALEGK